MNGYWQLWNPRISSFKNNTKATKICFIHARLTTAYSNGKQDLKFITQERSVQQQGKCWCRPNIFSAYCKFYFRVITLVVISLTVPGSNMKQILHSDWLIKWLSRAFCSLFLFLWTSTSSGPKNAKKNMINIQPSWPHTTYIYWRKESAM